MIGVNTIDYFVYTHSLCSLNTPGNSLHTFGVPKTGQAVTHLLACVKTTYDIFSV